jgi:enoyl-CoA hydratase/carnithine racemase
MDLLLTGRIFDAEEALRLGLVNEVVEQAALAGRLKTLADALIANSPLALKATKRLVTATNRAWLNAAIIDGIEAGTEARMTPDFREGIAAFLEKRKPVWQE